MTQSDGLIYSVHPILLRMYQFLSPNCTGLSARKLRRQPLNSSELNYTIKHQMIEGHATDKAFTVKPALKYNDISIQIIGKKKSSLHKQGAMFLLHQFFDRLDFSIYI